MVYNRYSTYNNVMKYFISFDISQLLVRESKVKPQNKKFNFSKTNIPFDDSKQNLVIIPDNRSRKNQLSDFFFTRFCYKFIFHRYSKS